MNLLFTRILAILCCALSVVGFSSKSKARIMTPPHSNNRSDSGKISCQVIDGFNRPTGFLFNFHYYKSVAFSSFWKVLPDKDELQQKSFAKIITHLDDEFAKVASEAIAQPVAGFVYRDKTNPLIPLNVRALLNTSSSCNNIQGELIITEIQGQSTRSSLENEAILSSQSLKCKREDLHASIKDYLKRFLSDRLKHSFCN